MICLSRVGMDTMDSWHFARAKKEVAHCVSVLVSALDKTLDDIPSLSDIVMHYTRPYFEKVITVSNNGTHGHSLTISDLYKKLVLTCGEAYYQKAASYFLHPSRRHRFSDLYLVCTQSENAELNRLIRLIPAPVSTMYTWEGQEEKIDAIMIFQRCFTGSVILKCG